ncbi:MAG: metallophosphoesterase [Desulfuromonadales bacterium]|nr:metallophosphoesterase [Desulfuromonadales bacterium]
MTRTGHMVVFLGFFAIVIALSHFFLFAHISYFLQLPDGQRRIPALLLGGLAVLTFISIPVSRMLPREAEKAFAWIVFPWMGLTLLMIVSMLAADMFWLLLNLVPAAPIHDPNRRFLIQRALGITALGASGLLGVYSLWNGLRQVTVKPLTVMLNRLPKSLDGLKIVQITDLHIGPIIDGKWLRQIVDKVNALEPDIIVVTGDLADGSVEKLGRHVAPVADLAAPLGVYFITGNHEYYYGVEPWCAHIEDLGLAVLRNERVSIVAGAQSDSFDLAGVNDWSSGQFAGQGPDLSKALAGRDQDKALVLLAHQPVAIDEAAAHSVDFQLSGHTHGGQIWPFNYVVQLQQPYVKGFHRHRDTATQIYVSSGTGFWGPPMRFGTSAEITNITLRSSA